MCNNIKKNILTLFGIGNIEFAPGSFASLFACLFFSLLIIFKINLIFLLLLFFILIPYSIFLINSNSHLFNDIDAKEIVIDEFIGQSIPIFFGYFYIDKISNFNFNIDKLLLIKFMIIAFLTFRFFDISKLYPINLIDKIKNGYGVVLDDMLAGVYSSIVTLLVFNYKILS
jgi:phosphatidylglycerophosphatase A